MPTRVVAHCTYLGYNISELHNRTHIKVNTLTFSVRPILYLLLVPLKNLMDCDGEPFILMSSPNVTTRCTRTVMLLMRLINVNFEEE